MKRFCSLLFGAALLVANATADIILWESFDIPVSDPLSGQAGGTSVGWMEPWTHSPSSTGSGEVAAGSLSLPAGTELFFQGVTGNRALFMGLEANGRRSNRLTPGNSYWFAFVASATANFGALPTGVHFSFKSDCCGGRFYAHFFAPSNGDFWLLSLPDRSDISSGVPDLSANVLIIANVEFSVDGANDRVRAWFNADPRTAVPQIDVTGEFGQAEERLHVAANSSNNFNGSFIHVDEIRVGTELADILVPPTPRFEYTVNFDGAQLDRNFQPLTAGPDLNADNPGPGFSVANVDGRLRLQKESGTGNGTAIFRSRFLITGDFEITVEGDRTALGQGEAGPLVYFPTGFFDVFFSSAGQIGAVASVPPAPDASNGINNNATSGTLKLVRAGNNLQATFDNSQFFNATHDLYREPVKVGIFLLQVHNFTALSAATFDNFTIRADGILPYLDIQRSGENLQLIWPAAAAGFELQAGEILPAGPAWTTVNAPAEIVGLDKIVQVPIAGAARFFRLVK